MTLNRQARIATAVATLPPVLLRCTGCGTLRAHRHQHCGRCGEPTDSYEDRRS